VLCIVPQHRGFAWLQALFVEPPFKKKNEPSYPLYIWEYPPELTTPLRVKPVGGGGTFTPVTQFQCQKWCSSHSSWLRVHTWRPLLSSRANRGWSIGQSRGVWEGAPMCGGKTGGNACRRPVGRLQNTGRVACRTPPAGTAPNPLGGGDACLIECTPSWRASATPMTP
jgi:hypothetical protein